MEERVRVSNRIASLKEAGNIERQQQYELRIRQIEENERMKREMQLQSQLRRDQLERQKEDIQSGVVTQSDLRKKGAVRIQGLATEMGIDLETLREKARQIRRGKSSVRSSLPPVRP
jgi:UDP-N-acetylglucosamine enolpyruvyl transferase